MNRKDEEKETDAEPQVWSVSKLNKSIKSLLEGQFCSFWVKGEISNFKAHSSGHFYFSIKDQKAQIRVVMFKGANGKLKFRPEDGLEVLISGRISVYEPRGDYQVLCDLMEPVGAGALQLAYEQLKMKLSNEGLFDPQRKRPLPRLPRHVAIVTSPTGAAICDMIHVLGRRFKGLKITVVPTTVQGPQAPKQIVQALANVASLEGVDVVIVGRGGGSMEDLWAFNDEMVARAIVACPKPVISAVGHEVDFTIADFVADLRAPTPSAAAEVVVKNGEDLVERVDALGRTLRILMQRRLDIDQKSVVALSHRLVDPQRRLQDLMLRCDELSQKLENGFSRWVKDRRVEVKQFGSVLHSLSPLRVVERGYSIVTAGEQVVKSTDQVKVGSHIEIQFAKGLAEAQITKIKRE